MTATQIIPQAPEISKVLEQAGMEWEFKQSLIIAFTPFLSQAEQWQKEALWIVITEESDEEWMKNAREMRLKIKDIRCDAENARKRYKDWFLKGGRAVDAVYSVIENITKPTEEYLLLQEKFAEIQEQNRREQRKSSRIIELQKYEVDPQGYDLVNMADENFENLVNMSRLAFDDRKIKEKEVEEARLAQEKAEKEEREKTRLENEKLKTRNDLILRIQSCNTKEEIASILNDIMDADEDIQALAKNRRVEIEEKEAQIIEQHQLQKSKEDAEKKANEAEKARIAQVQYHEKWKREQLKKQEDEVAKKRHEDALEEQRIRELKVKEKRAPDKEKLLKLASDIDNIVFPACTSEEAYEVLKQTTILISKVTAYIRNNANAL